MFMRCHYFNKPLNNWNVSKVTDMSGMFDMATEFNQPLNNWKLSSDVVTVDMFHSAYEFKQDLSSWDLSHIPVSRRRGMFTLSKMTKKCLPKFK
jgi:surface protein